MLGRALRLIRVFHDVSQGKLAQKLGISNSFLSEIETEKKTPSVELLGKYSEIFEIPMSSILLFAENMETPARPRKKWIADKILKLLEYVDARAREEEDRVQD